MGRSRGLEPPTLGTTNRCSNQLSYDRHGEQRSGSFGRARHLRGQHHEGKDAGRRCRITAATDKFGLRTVQLPSSADISVVTRARNLGSCAHRYASASFHKGEANDELPHEIAREWRHAQRDADRGGTSSLIWHKCWMRCRIASSRWTRADLFESQAQLATKSMFVRSGILSKFKSDTAGRRQIVALRFPGEGILPREGTATTVSGDCP